MWIAFRSVDGFAKQSLTQNLGHPPLENSVRMGSQSLVCCVWRYGDPAKREPEQLLIEWPRGKDRPENHFLSKARVPPPCQYIAAYGISHQIAAPKKRCAIRYSAKFLPYPKISGHIAPLRRQRHMPDSITTPRLECALGMFVLRKAEG